MCCRSLDCVQGFMNKKDTEIEVLKEMLAERDARIAALEKELADFKARQYPTFITRSTFVQHSA